MGRLVTKSFSDQTNENCDHFLVDTEEVVGH